MVEFSCMVIKPQQQRSHFPAFLGPAKAAHNAVGRAYALDLDHSSTIARRVFAIQALGHYAIQT